jgi:hypothetical protein
LTAERASEWPELFYIYVLDQIAPPIPVWGLEIGRETLDRPERDEINSALEKWLPIEREHPTAKRAFEHLRGGSKFGQLSVAAFFYVLERARRIIVDFPRVDEPRLRLRRLRLFDVALPVLADPYAGYGYSGGYGYRYGNRGYRYRNHRIQEERSLPPRRGE